MDTPLPFVGKEGWRPVTVVDPKTGAIIETGEYKYTAPTPYAIVTSKEAQLAIASTLPTVPEARFVSFKQAGTAVKEVGSDINKGLKTINADQRGSIGVITLEPRPIKTPTIEPVEPDLFPGRNPEITNPKTPNPFEPYVNPETVPGPGVKSVPAINPEELPVVPKIKPVIPEPKVIPVREPIPIIPIIEPPVVEPEIKPDVKPVTEPVRLPEPKIEPEINPIETTEPKPETVIKKEVIANPITEPIIEPNTETVSLTNPVPQSENKTNINSVTGSSPKTNTVTTNIPIIKIPKITVPENIKPGGARPPIKIPLPELPKKLNQTNSSGGGTRFGRKVQLQKQTQKIPKLNVYMPSNKIVFYGDTLTEWTAKTVVKESKMYAGSGVPGKSYRGHTIITRNRIGNI